MRLIDADALRKNAWKAERFSPDMLVVGLGFILDAPTIESPRPDWTPCAEGIPEVQKDVHVTILENNGRLTRTEAYIHRFDGVWHYAKSPLQLVAGTVIAWQSYPEPYNPDHIRDATKKVDQFREPTKMMQNDMRRRSANDK